MSYNDIIFKAVTRQALITDIYNELVPLTMKRGKARLVLNEANSRPWMSTEAYMTSFDVKLNNLTMSDNEARSKSAIKNKLRKLDADGRHELVANFLMNKMIPLIDAPENAGWTWKSKKSMIVRIFENDLIDQYRKANTRQGRFDSSIESTAPELLNAAADNRNLDNEAAETLINEKTTMIASKFNSFCETLDQKDRYILEGMVLVGLTSTFLSKALKMHEDSILRRKKQLMAAFRTSIMVEGV